MARRVPSGLQTTSLNSRAPLSTVSRGSPVVASQTRLPPFLAPMVSFVPSGLQETVSTELPGPRTSRVWPVAASQTRTVSSCEPVATRRESGLQAREQAHWV